MQHFDQYLGFKLAGTGMRKAVRRDRECITVVDESADNAGCM